MPSVTIQNSFHHSRADPLLKSSVESLATPITLGNIRQGAPVRSTHKMPFKTARRSFHGRRRPSVRSVAWGIRSYCIFHCASVRSWALDLDIAFSPNKQIAFQSQTFMGTSDRNDESGTLLLGRHEYGRLHEGVLTADFCEHIRWLGPRSCSCTGCDPVHAIACSCSHAPRYG